MAGAHPQKISKHFPIVFRLKTDVTAMLNHPELPINLKITILKTTRDPVRRFPILDKIPRRLKTRKLPHASHAKKSN